MIARLRAGALACCLILPATTAANTVEAPLPPRIDAMEFFKALTAANIGGAGRTENPDALERRRADFQFRKLTLSDEMMVTFAPSTLPNCQRNIDEAGAAIGFSCTFKSGQGDHSKGLLIPLTQRVVGQGHYVAANALDHRVTVERREIARAGLMAVTNVSHSVGESVLSVSGIPIPSGKFVREWAQLQVGMVFKPQAPFADTDFTGKNATLSDPYEVSVRTEAVVGLISRVHVFRKGDAKPVMSFRPLLRGDGVPGVYGSMAFERIQTGHGITAVAE